MNTLQWRAAKSSKIVRMLFTHRRYVLMHKGCASSRQPLIRWLHVIDFYLLFLYRYMSIKLFLNLFIYLSMYLSIFVCRSLSICLCLSLIHTPSDCLSVCVSAYLSLTQAIRHYLSLLVTSPSLTSCHLTISHFLSPSLTSCHLTISHFLSPHHLSLLVLTDVLGCWSIGMLQNLERRLHYKSCTSEHNWSWIILTLIA